MVDQVGGTHYRTGDAQHWDVVPGQAAYLLGCASKYVSRHRSKSGRQDVEKAISYLEKIVEAGCRLSVVNENEIVWEEMRAWGRSVPKMSLLDWTAIEEMYTGQFTNALGTLRRILEQDYDAEKIAETNDTGPKVMIPRAVPRFTGPRLPGPAKMAMSERQSMLPTTPWIVSDEWLTRKVTDKILNDEQIRAFYTRWAPNIHKLEPYLDHRLLPPALFPCYTGTGSVGVGWLLDVDKVPSQVRDMFPYLEREVNTMQLDELPEWQRALYREESTKWVLTREAWSRDDH